MKILLTGGSGFVGQHIRESLGETYTIVAPTHAELDVTDAAQVDRILRDGRFDAVIHAAVEGGAHVLDSTLRGFWNLSRNAGRVDRILYFGSGAEYGKHRDLIEITEERIGDETPRDAYGFAKLLCNTIARASGNIVNLRLFGVYGPHEGYKLKFISNAVAKTLAGFPLVIRQNVVFDYLWIDDLVRLLPRFLEGERAFGDVNVTPTQSVSLAEIASIVLRRLHREAAFETELPGFNYQYTGDNARLLQLCPGFTFTSIEDGVQSLIAHYAARVGTLDRDALGADDYRRRCMTRASAAEGMERHT